MPQKQKAKSQIRDYYQDAVKKCKKCGMEYKGYRRDHNKKFHGKNLEPADSEACNMCKATVRSAQLQRHQLLRHAEYTCDLCGDTFVGRNKLNLHVVLHLEKQFICNACQKQYHRKDALCNHLRTHFEKYVCQHCGQQLVTFEKFQRHLYSHDHNPNLILSIQPREFYPCRHCPREFTSILHRNSHEDGVHKNRSQPAFQCQACKDVFLTKEDLRIHSFDHYCGTIYYCPKPDCGKYFKSPKNLRIHSKIHLPPKYQCELCQYQFAQSTNYIKHKKRCKGPKKVHTLEELEEMRRIAEEQFKQFGLSLKYRKRTNEEGHLLSTKLKTQRKKQQQTNTKPELKQEEAVEYLIIETIEEEENLPETAESFEEEHLNCNDENVEMVDVKMESEEDNEQILEDNMLELDPVVMPRQIEPEYHESWKRKIEPKEENDRNNQEIDNISQTVKKKRLADTSRAKFYQTRYKDSDYNVSISKKWRKAKFNCDICSAELIGAKALRHHLYQHHAENKRKCSRCNVKFETSFDLLAHKKLFHQPKIVTAQNVCECDHCGKHMTHSKMAVHMIHHKAPSVECPDCKMKFKTRGNMNKHYNFAHIGERSFICEICSKAFKANYHLIGHLKTHGPPQECPVCHKFLPDINRHMKIHTNPKASPSFQCPVCGKMCSTKQQCQLHVQRVHEKVPLGRVYSCPTCQENFIRFADLRLHQFIHYQGRIVECPYPECNAMFKKPFLLRSHMLVHQNKIELTFECQFCPDKKYARKSALYKHQKNHHPEIFATSEDLNVKIE